MITSISSLCPTGNPTYQDIMKSLGPRATSAAPAQPSSAAEALPPVHLKFTGEMVQESKQLRDGPADPVCAGLTPIHPMAYLSILTSVRAGFRGPDLQLGSCHAAFPRRARMVFSSRREPGIRPGKNILHR